MSLKFSMCLLARSDIKAKPEKNRDKRRKTGKTETGKNRDREKPGPGKIETGKTGTGKNRDREKPGPGKIETGKTGTGKNRDRDNPDRVARSRLGLGTCLVNVRRLG